MEMTTSYIDGFQAWIDHSMGKHDGINPHTVGTEDHKMWEDGWQRAIDKQFELLQAEEMEQQKQMKLL